MQFRTKARAVDLLGKGQIADLPTAITELWKNGYDAYASVLTAEIFKTGYKGLESPIFMMTDDGLGMSQTDILDKWLVLGTDSKSRREKDKEGESTLFKKPRIKAGEKGIGRLSVAFLGSPMLMLTKKIGHPVQVVLFDWRLLENFNLFLDDISIPIMEFEKGSSTQELISDLKEGFLNNFKKVKDSDGELIWSGEQEQLKKQIVRSINSLALPSFFEEQIVNNLTDKNSHGTKFVIFEPTEEIVNLVGTRDDNNTEDDFVRSNLNGFVNPFIDLNSDIKIQFPVHQDIGNDYDYLLGNSIFFTSKDFSLADIIINGTFDGKGNFNGELKIFDETVNYTFSNQRKRYKKIDFGRVEIKLGYTLGTDKDSKFDKKKRTSILNKVARFGGLYLYRDNFRVLPYGREDYDFLEFEKRRSIRAGDYFFSYRRMFGYLDLSRERNSSLKDKSSREGLINNAEFKVFRSDLIAFFIKLAGDYFGSRPENNLFADQKKMHQEQHAALKLDKSRIAAEKRSFTAALKTYPGKLETYKNTYEDHLSKLEKLISNENISYSSIEDHLSAIKRMDIEYLELIPEHPTKYKPTDRQLDLLEKYAEQIKEFNETIKEDSKSLLERVQEKLAIQDLHKQFDADAEQYRAKLQSLIFAHRSILSEKIQSLQREFNQKTNSALDEIDLKKQKLKSRIESKYDIISSIREINEKFEALRKELKHEVFPLVSHIDQLGFDVNEEVLQGAYRTEYENIKHQWEQTKDTAQLGIAVEIIDHEFNVLYSQINASIKKLDKSIEKKSKADFTRLASFFKSLEDKYALLSPLYRDAGAIEKEISGKKVYEYLLNFFDKKVAEEGITMKATQNFTKHTFEGREPVVHTVFINIVNNAIFWLRSSEKKEILFDFNKKTGEMLILNSGEPIEEHRIEKIFDLFVSNRPGGRGIGLYLSKESLASNYFELYATNDEEYNKLNGACFVIKPMN